MSLPAHLLAALLAAAPTGGEARLALSALPDDADLARLVWQASPDLQAARARLAAARADAERAGLLPNPVVDLSWNTVPIGSTNPPGLRPLKDVPNYAAGLSELVELGKRGPRRRSAEETARAAELDALDSLRAKVLELWGHLGAVAAAQVRSATLAGLAADAERLTEITRRRTRQGDAARLDVDRAALEQDKISGALQAEQARLAQELVLCGDLAGAPCDPFRDGDQATLFLSRSAAAEAPLPGPEDRPDVRSLEAQDRAASEARDLARARWIPDLTLRLGFVRDLFAVSGSQPRSAFIGVSLPLPVFDRGQAEERAALVQGRAARSAREALLGSARRDAEQLEAQARALADRRRHLRDEMVPAARSVVARLEAAVQEGAASLADVLQARRTLGELLLDAADADRAAFDLSLARRRLSGAGPSRLPEIAAP